MPQKLFVQELIRAFWESALAKGRELLHRIYRVWFCGHHLFRPEPLFPVDSQTDVDDM